MVRGGLLSLGDYEDNRAVEQCLAEDCDYSLAIVLTMKHSSREKEVRLSTVFSGKSVRMEQSISSFTFFLEDGESVFYRP